MLDHYNSYKSMRQSTVTIDDNQLKMLEERIEEAKVLN